MGQQWIETRVFREQVKNGGADYGVYDHLGEGHVL
jgi:hypothetical protein